MTWYFITESGPPRLRLLSYIHVSPMKAVLSKVLVRSPINVNEVRYPFVRLKTRTHFSSLPSQSEEMKNTIQRLSAIVMYDDDDDDDGRIEVYSSEQSFAIVTVSISIACRETL